MSMGSLQRGLHSQRANCSDSDGEGGARTTFLAVDERSHEILKHWSSPSSASVVSTEERRTAAESRSRSRSPRRHRLDGAAVTEAWVVRLSLAMAVCAPDVAAPGWNLISSANSPASWGRKERGWIKRCVGEGG